ncbi:TonB-dependent siderophore receptor [Pseudomonas sp. ABC1]|uniref:TonB-dependent siderophore receptor n=1 Tax=Pseudomonas sp. ABC1 TaxID=2748080 RepID=UPI0015C2CFC2|nr:TonB-dependent siderophore receptor [Pseudomonas sp. ABC1]QLF91968.1 TonB-dependent siderophore receptor [Pseudomonas sp. ABC1]
MRKPLPATARINPLPAAIRRALLCSSLLLSPALVHAQDAVRHYQLPQEALSQSLTRFAAEAGVVLSFDARLTQGLSSNGLRGEYDIASGLRQLLAGSGLQAVLAEQGRYLLLPINSSENALELSATNVVSNQLGTITEGSGSYAAVTIATATRLVLTPRQTPQTITVSTRQYMDDFGLNGIDDVMRRTPGVSVGTYDSERTFYYSRGFTIQNFQYDGIPTLRDDAYSSGATLSDTSIYDRIEVIKGASGLLSGAGAPGATINLVRKKPTREFAGHASLGVGSWDNYRSELDISGPLTASGNIRGRAVTAYNDKHSFQDHYERKTSTYYGILEIDLGEDTLLSVGADYQDNNPKGSSWGGIPLYDNRGDLVETSRSFNPGADWSGWAQYTRSIFTALEHKFSNGWIAKGELSHKINGYRAAMGSASGSYPDPVTGTGVTMFHGKYTGETKSDSVELYAQGPFQWLGREHDLVAGVSGSQAKWDGKGYYNSAYNRNVSDFYNWNGNVAEPNWGSAFMVNEQTTRQLGSYITARFKPTDDLALILGSRLANYSRTGDTNSRETGRLVPYAGLVYDLNDTYSVYASYTTIFNPQSKLDRNQKALEPDTGDNYELGLKGEYFEGRLNASLAYFEVHQDNRAEADTAYNSNPVHPGLTYAYEGVKAKTKGYELEISGELATNWQVQAGYVHKTIHGTGNKKLSTWEPEDQLSIHTSYKLSGALDDLTLGGGARWQSKAWQSVTNPVRGTENVTQSAYWLLDLMARYRISENLSTTLNMNNVLDKKYYTNIGFYNSIYYGEPRNLMLTTRYDF